MDVLMVLQRLGAGRVLGDLDEALTVTAGNVVETGKPGTVTLTMKITTKSQGDPLIVIDGTISRTVPKKDPTGAYFFAMDGELHRDDPRQPELPTMRTIDRETGEIREAESREPVRRAIL